MQNIPVSDSQRLVDRIGPLFERSTVALTLADPSQADCPLVIVNSAFTTATGYSAEDALGRNCRFLQPPGGAGPVRGAMRVFLADPAQENGRFVVPNQRRDGTPFLNLVYMAKLNHNGGSGLILGSQFTVTTDRGREDLYDRALRESLDQIRDLFVGSEWSLLGSSDAVASSLALIARFHLENGD